MGEGLQIALQGTGVGRVAEPDRERRRVLGGQALVAARAGQLDDGGGAQTTVEVVVEDGLGRAAYPVGDRLGGRVVRQVHDRGVYSLGRAG
ncbi:hypothetical protein GCM10010278_39390 [Streptomyces melanogenes]|nr:hypothetical protein GCM10010278_39390 [Streptomyces melanogenes]